MIIPNQYALLSTNTDRASGLFFHIGGLFTPIAEPMIPPWKLRDS